MRTLPVTPDPLIQISSGLWAAGLLKSAVELQVFDALAHGEQEAATLSQALGAQAEPLRILLDALVALGFIEARPQGYGLTPVSAEFLVSSKPTYLGPFVAEILTTPGLFDLYKDYRRVVTEGYRINPWEYATGSNERIVRLTRMLFTLGAPTAQAIADHMGWQAADTRALHLLDVGCGSAVYGLIALTRLPRARLTAQDWPLILPVAQDYAAQLGVADRVQTLVGDFRTVPFGGPYDGIFLGHILHNYPEPTCREILSKCFAALQPGGVVIVVEFLAERGKPESLFSWLFSTMVQGTLGGRSFSGAEIRQLLADCGGSRTEVGGGLPVGFVLGYR